MRFVVFVLTLGAASVAILYVLGDQRQPVTRTITAPVVLHDGGER